MPVSLEKDQDGKLIGPGNYTIKAVRFYEGVDKKKYEVESNEIKVRIE